MPAPYKDAYYQLVLHPVEACANLNELYYNTALNKLYAAQGRADANFTAERVKQLFAKDAEISNYYNKVLAGGKWDHMMDQTHIGYTYWQQPPVDKMPDVKTLGLPASPQMGVAVEGSESWWPHESGKPVLPAFSPLEKGGHYVEIFNRGQGEFDFTAASAAPYVTVSAKNGRITTGQRLWVNVDWAKAPNGMHRVQLTFTGLNNRVTVGAVINNLSPSLEKGFYENDGYVSMEAAHYSKAVRSASAGWQIIPAYGRTLSGVMPSPATIKRQSPGGSSPHLEYEFNLTDTGFVKVKAYISPTLDFKNAEGLHYAVSIDNEPSQQVNIDADESQAGWSNDVARNIKVLTTSHRIGKPGKHILKYWMVDPAVVLQKIVIDAGGEKPCYLGPPESFRK